MYKTPQPNPEYTHGHADDHATGADRATGNNISNAPDSTPGNTPHNIPRNTPVITPGKSPDETTVTMAMTHARHSFDQGQLADAAALYQRWLERCTNVNAWIDAGELADAMGEHDLAIKRLQHAIDISNSDQHNQRDQRNQRNHAIESLAIVHLHAGRFATAGRCWWRIIRLHDNNAAPVRAWAGLLSSAIAHGNLRLAKKLMHAWHTHSSPAERRQAMTQIHLHVAMGMTIGNMTPNHNSDSKLSNPTYPTHANRVPTNLTELVSHSVAILRDHADKHPDRADTHYHLAMCECLLGLSDAAQKNVAQAVRINPRYRSAVNLRQNFAA